MGKFSDYFSVMALTKLQRKKREEAAEDFETILILYLLLIAEQYRHGYKDFRFARENFITQYSEAVSKYTVDTAFISDYVPSLATDLLDATLRNIDREYFTSEDRAVTIAQNESLNVLNKADFDTAIELGYKRKKWLTEKDERVRETHIKMDDKIIPITDVYIVGESVMRFPHDLRYGPDPNEIVNCRCAIDYLR